MIVPSRQSCFALVKAVSPTIGFFLVLCVLLAFAHTHMGTDALRVPKDYVTILGAAVGVFLAFRINSGYGRWWEARTIWGDLVNTSRAFGIDVASVLPRQDAVDEPEAEQQAARRRQLVMAHIGFINALRIHLRREECWDEIAPFFEPDDYQHLRRQANIPAQIITLQAARLAEYFSAFPDMDLRYLHTMDKLDRFYAIQGKCERIKNTVFPWGYATYTRIFVWLMAVLLPFNLITGFDAQGIVLCSLTSFVFVTIERVGRNLDNPFEGRFNDTPMSALCRSIEIDMRQQLGEREVPEPLVASGGALM